MTEMEMAPPLLRLPPEITHRIAAFMRVPDSDTDGDEGSPVEDEDASAMSASEKFKCDFCALRLTCKDLYVKTFRLFGRSYFTTLSVGFNLASLDRLRTLASYKNSFGLTLFEFPSHLIVSTLRLLPESEADRIFSVSDPQENAQAVVATIKMLCELAIESYNVPGTYNPDIYAIAGKYRKAVASQQSLTTSNLDINKIARAIATFPKFCSIALDAYNPSWGEEDWEEIAGFDRTVFTSFGDIPTGQNNLEFALNRVLQNIKLQKLDIHPFSRVALQAALSRLTSLFIDIYDFVTPEEPKDSSSKIKEALEVLLSSPELKLLTIGFVDHGVDIEDDLTNMSQPDNTWIGDEILSMIAEVDQSNALERLTLFCFAIMKSKDAVEKLIKKHAGTLEAFSLEIVIPDPGVEPPNVHAKRNQYKSLLRALTGCPLLEQFSFHVEPDGDDCPVANFDMCGREWIMKRVQSMIKSPTGPEYDDFWADDSETEDGEEEDDDDDDD